MDSLKNVQKLNICTNVTIMKSVNHRLLITNWDGINNCDDPNEAFHVYKFFNIFNSIYDINLLKGFIKIKK